MPDNLELALDRRLPFEVRAAAVKELMIESWRKGWDACVEETERVFREAGLTPPPRKERLDA